MKWISTFLLCSWALVSAAQIEIKNVSQLALIKQGTTYIVLPENDSELLELYEEQVLPRWTYSKAKVIMVNQLWEHLTPNDSYLMTGGFLRLENGSPVGGQVYLELFTVDKSFFKKKKETLKDSDKYIVARILLADGSVTEERINTLSKWSWTIYDNGKPGIVANYLSELSRLLKVGKTRSITTRTENIGALQVLRNTTLYIPSYVIENTGGQTTEQIMAEYAFGYEVLPNNKIDSLIFSGEPAYYLLFVQTENQKFTHVVNASTGEFIYSDYSNTQFYMGIRPKYLSYLTRAINAKKK